MDPELCYRLMRARDARFDGQFFTGVVTTKIYCRPVCPATAPKFENCRFYPSSAAAQDAGFRPCLRCRPEVSPGLPAWIGTSATVTRALRLIEDGGLPSVDELAAKLGVGDRHLRRLFLKHLGATPAAVISNRRILFAKKLLTETSMPATDVAFASGFGSVRQFNEAMSKVFGRTPTQLRGKAARMAGPLVLRLGYRQPYDFAAILRFLGPRAIPGVETVADGSYSRNVRLGGEAGHVAVRDLPESNCIEARIRFDGPPAKVQQIVERLRRIFDLRANALEISRHFESADPALGYRASTRVPGCWDPFELFVRAILGQQITVAGATTLAGRIVAKYGDPCKYGGSLFPGPEPLAREDFEGIGLTQQRIRTLRGIAGSFAFGNIDLTEGLGDFVSKFGLLEGIGPWTAHYAAMRAANQPDAFPSSDLGLRKAAGGISQKELERRAEAWRPWRAYAAMHLWSSDRSPSR